MILPPNLPCRVPRSPMLWRRGARSVVGLNARVVLKLVPTVVDLMAPDIVEVDTREHHEREHAWKLHAKQGLAAHVKAHVDRIPGEREHDSARRGNLRGSTVEKRWLELE